METSDISAKWSAQPIAWQSNLDQQVLTAGLWPKLGHQAILSRSPRVFRDCQMFFSCSSRPYQLHLRRIICAKQCHTCILYMGPDSTTFFDYRISITM